MRVTLYGSHRMTKVQTALLRQHAFSRGKAMLKKQHFTYFLLLSSMLLLLMTNTLPVGVHNLLENQQIKQCTLSPPL